jgi:hypothetical protein
MTHGSAAKDLTAHVKTRQTLNMPAAASGSLTSPTYQKPPPKTECRVRGGNLQIRREKHSRVASATYKTLMLSDVVRLIKVIHLNKSTGISNMP